MSYPSYLIHYNKNHSKKNGQFISGDGDSDGVADEHHRYSKKGISVKSETKTGKYKPYLAKRKEKYEGTRTTVTKNAGNRKLIDDLVYDKKDGNKEDFFPSSYGDFLGASKLLDNSCQKATEIYEKTNDINKAIKYLTDNIKNVPYEVVFRKDTYWENKGKDFVTDYSYELTAYGNKYVYGSVGGTSDSDDEYFWFNEEKK